MDPSTMMGASTTLPRRAWTPNTTGAVSDAIASSASRRCVRGRDRSVVSEVMERMVGWSAAAPRARYDSSHPTSITLRPL